MIDSGAIDHICYDLNQFVSYSKLPNSDHCITVPDGRKAFVTYIGQVELSPEITLHNVLYVPNFCFNLISVHRLVQDLGCSVVFNTNGCVLQGPSMRRPLVLGDLSQGLYYTSFQPPSSAASPQTTHERCVNSCKTDNKTLDAAKLWHLRLGHAPFRHLKHIDSSLYISDMSEHILCTVCPRARQCRLSLTHSEIKTTKVFQLLHIDIWGPYKHTTHNGRSIFLTIVDDYSRATWTYLMKYKSDCVPTLHAFLTYVHSQFDSSVKIIRSDNAKELCEGNILKLYNDHGIIHQTSCVDTPQQNGVVERKHRHLLETTRALFFQSNLPIRFWGECVQTATYLINRLPLPSLNYQSPYARLFSSVPDYSHLKAFGCLCFTSTLKQGRSKLDARAHPCVFIGYPFAQKGYRVYDLVSKRILVSRDLVFHERHFPFHFASPSQTKPLPFFLPVSTPPSNFIPNSFDDSFQPTIPSQNPIAPPPPSAVPTSPIPTAPPSTLIDLTDPASFSSPPVRASTRPHKPPSYLKDFVCQPSIHYPMVKRQLVVNGFIRSSAKPIVPLNDTKLGLLPKVTLKNMA